MTYMTRGTFVSLALVGALVLVPAVAGAAPLYRQLQFGMSGSDVSDLQTFLARDTTIYPQGLVTGYFGSLTRSAVSNFQARNGIDTVGRVGPITMQAINAQMGGTVGGDVTVPVISSFTVATTSTSATFSWNTNEATKGVVYYSTSPLTLSESGKSVIVSGSSAMMDTSFRTSQNIVLQGLQSNTVYYYVVHTVDASGNTTITWPTTFRTTN